MFANVNLKIFFQLILTLFILKNLTLNKKLFTALKNSLRKNMVLLKSPRSCKSLISLHFFPEKKNLG